MKTPRINDFDPDAKAPILKSSLDNMPSIEKHTSKSKSVSRPYSPTPLPLNNPQHHKATVKTEKPYATSNTSVRGVRPVLPVLPVPPKRAMKQRWPVDIYEDQYESLQRLSLEDRMQGGVGSMSAMVREALDKLINERQKSHK
jgi:hypothetical protein